VIGTRPEGVKLAPVVDALGRKADVIECRVALTGQHSDLMDQVIETFDIRPQWDLEVMREGQSLYDVVGDCLVGLREVLSECRPDLVLAQGDTASVFTAGLVTFFERSHLGHVEAGLRSRDKWRPWPEEIFRRLTGVVADLHFAPTPGAADNLLKEGVSPDAIHVTGNTVVDALLRVAGQPHEPTNPALRDALSDGRRLVLVTAHRRESFGAPLREAFSAIRELTDRYPDIDVLYPVHPNPNVTEAAAEVLSGHPRIRLTQPLDYLDLVTALRRATLAITDSGGIQEEAPTFETPVLVLRDVTERPEGVQAGIAAVVGTDRERILSHATDILDAKEGQGWRALHRRLHTAAEADAATDAGLREPDIGYPNPYGDGRAGERIADIVVHRLTGRPRETEDWSGPA
jgi:UDP-N-acetylglucosamine 2-epimerase (non-hydrolysing)